MPQQSVLVTGASSGIGLETAVRLAEYGYRVYAGLRDLGRAPRLLAEAERRSVDVVPLQVDVVEPQSVREAFAEIERGPGELYAVVNNAGVIVRGFFEDVSEDEIRRVFDTNLFGAMAVTRAAVPLLRKRRGGRIVMMSSTGGRLASPGNVAYCSSKFALEGFGECLRQELEPFGVKVSLIEPGFVQTELFGRNHNVAQAAANDASPYADLFRRLETLTEREVRSATTTSHEVADVVAHVLKVKNPLLRYVVGRRAKLLFALRRHLPGEVFDRFWRREIQRRLNVSEAKGA